MRRVDLSPFFDPRFIAFARRTAPADKRGSRAMAAVLEALDPELAALPLDGRPSPAALWRAAPPPAASPPVAPPPAARPAVLAGPVGAEAIRAAVCAAAAAAGRSLTRAAALPLFTAGALDHGLRPDSPLTVVALGFALNVEGILEFLEEARSPAAAVSTPRPGG
jgi:hypothetical protein